MVNNVVYAVIHSAQSKYGSLYALDARDGSVLWHVDQLQVLSGDAVVDGVVYATLPVNPQAGIFGLAAFNAQNGDVLWHYQPGHDGVSFVQAAKGQVYALVSSMGASQSYLAVPNARDGSGRWRYPQSGYAHLQELGVE